MPGSASIGLFAPALLLVGRLLQSFSAGAEVGGVSVYLAEIATRGKKNSYVSWQSASQQVSVVVAAALGFAVRAYLTSEFKVRTHHPKAPEILRSMVTDWKVVIAGMMMVAMTTTSFYLITVFGGLTPLISTWLISGTHDKAAPGYWLTIAAICGLAATLILFHRASVERRAASMAH